MIASRQIAFGKAAGAKKPYKRQVKYIDTNGGGCTISDIVLAPTYGFRLISKVAIITYSGNILIGNTRYNFDNDNTAWRFFATSDNGRKFMDISTCRVDEFETPGDQHNHDFQDIDILIGDSRGTSHFIVNGESKLDQYGVRYRSAGSYPLSICKYGYSNAVYGRILISTLTLMQGDRTLADFIAVETNDGKAGLHDKISGGVYTSTTGNEFVLGDDL